MPVIELQNLRNKYPQYKDIDDMTLATKLASKYPQYADLVDKVKGESNPIVTKIPVKSEIGLPDRPLNMKPMTVEEQAKAQNVGAISRLTGQRVSDVQQGYEGKTPETGLVRTTDIGMFRDPTTKQLLQTIAHPAITGALTAGAITNPIGTAAGLAVAAPIFTGIDKATQKIEESLPKNTSPEVKELVGAAGYAGGLFLGGKALEKGPIMASKVSQKLKIPQTAQGMANRLINSYIKPKHVDSLYGNPGEGIAKEGIIFRSIGNGKNKVEAKLKNLYSALDNAYSAHINQKVDYDTALNPLKNLAVELGKHPKDNAAALVRIQNIIDDVSGVSTGTYKNFKQLNPIEARKLKQEIGEFIDWGYEGKANMEINNSLKKSYNIIDSITDKVAPETKDLNKRVTDLSSARKAINFRIDSENKKDPVPASWYGIINLPLQVMRSGVFKTTLASILSQKYPKLMAENAAVIPEVLNSIPKNERKALGQQVRLALPGASTKYGENFTARETMAGDVVKNNAPRSTFTGGKPSTSGKVIMGEDFNLRDAVIPTSTQKLLPAPKSIYGEGFTARNPKFQDYIRRKKTSLEVAKKAAPYLSDKWNELARGID